MSAMCENKECELKETCYRFKAIPKEYQWYLTNNKSFQQGCCFFEKIDGREVKECSL